MGVTASFDLSSVLLVGFNPGFTTFLLGSLEKLLKFFGISVSRLAKSVK